MSRLNGFTIEELQELVQALFCAEDEGDYLEIVVCQTLRGELYDELLKRTGQDGLTPNGA